MDPSAFPYADEWAALRAQRQREYEQMITLTRWGDLMDITNEIAQSCTTTSAPATTFVPKSTGFAQKLSQEHSYHSQEYSGFSTRFSTSMSNSGFGRTRM